MKNTHENMYIKVLNYFGSQTKLAKALGITKQAVNGWGGTIPKLRAYQIQAVTKGQISADSLISDEAA